MDIQLTDVTFHINENLDRQQRTELEKRLRSLTGVISVGNSDLTPHLMMVEYNPKDVNSKRLLEVVRAQGVHAEMIGL